MCFIFYEYFTGIFLFLHLVNFGSSLLSISVNATSLNSSEEIKNIFSHSDINESPLKGAPGTGNYGEGGLIQINISQPILRTSIKDLPENSTHTSILHDKSFVKNHNISSNIGKISHPSFDSYTVKALLPEKLGETGSNLFLGVPEVIHINGISSIKPRKGVHYNKIVPRKGVDYENESSHGSLESNPCFQLSENECYNTTGKQNLQCACCKEGNKLTEKIKQEITVNCKNCKAVNLLSSEKKICKNICCNSLSTTQHTNKNHINYEGASNSFQTATNTQNTSEKVESANNFLKEPVAKVDNVIVSLKKNSKKKPSVTKVPYDVEIMTEILKKNQQKVFVPIIVSLFLLPLIGILLFFLWKRTKEYWEKRYYKRMDFLIDGIYND